MSYEQVASIVPKRFVKSARVWSTWVPKGAFLSQTNAQVSSRMYIVSIVTPLTADEVANIYFDKEGLSSVVIIVQTVGIGTGSQNG